MSRKVDSQPGSGATGASQSAVSGTPSTSPGVEVQIVDKPGSGEEQGPAAPYNEGAAQAQQDTADVAAMLAERSQSRRKLADQRRAQQTQQSQRDRRDANRPVSPSAASLAGDQPKQADQSRRPSALASRAVEEALAGNRSQIYEEPMTYGGEGQEQLDEGLAATGYVDAGRSGTGEVVEHRTSRTKKAEPASKAAPKKKGALGRSPLGDDSGETRSDHPADKAMDFMARQQRAAAAPRPAPARRPSDDFSDAMDRESAVDDASARGEQPPALSPEDVDDAAQEAAEGARYATRAELLDRLSQADEAAWGPQPVKEAGGKTEDQILRDLQARATEGYRKAEAKAGAEAYPEEDRYDRKMFEDITREDEIEYDKRGKYREMSQDFVKYPWLLRIEGETMDVVGDKPRKRNQGGVYKRTLSKRASDNLERLSDALGGVSMTDCLRVVIIRGGITVDTQGNIGGVPADQFVLPEETLVRLCRDAILAVERSSNPFAMVPGAQPYMHKTRCYPLGYCPSFLMDALIAPEGSPWHGKSKEECAKIVGDEWLQRTLPAIIANTNHDGVGGMSQRYALYEGMRSLLALDGQTNSARAWGITAEAEFTVLQMMEETAALKDANADPALLMAREEGDRRAQENLAKLRRQAYKKVKRIERDEDGTEHVTVEREVYRDNIAQQTAHLGAAAARVNGLVLHIPVMAANFVEKWQSNGMTIIANKALMQGLVAGDYLTSEEADAFVLKKSTKEICTSDEAKEVMDAIQMLVGVGGQEAFAAFKTSDLPFTRDGAKKFLNEMIGREGDLTKVQRWTNNLNSFLSTLQGGNYGTRGIDNKRMLEMFMINMAVAKKNGKRYVDADAVDKMIMSKGFGAFVKEMASYPEMTNAFLSTTNLNMGRINPLKRQVELLLKRSAITDLVGSMALDTYVTYGVNVIQALVPFSNTLSFMALHAANDGLGFESDMSQYQLGGLDEFHDGLMKNIVYDAVKLGNNLLIGFITWGVIQMLGIKEPPEGFNIYDWVEYIIGGERRIPAWWMNDLVGWGLPFGVALAVTQYWGPERGWKVFQSGMADMVEGSSVVDMITLIANSGKNVEDLEAIMNGDNDDGYLQPPDKESFFRAQMIRFFVAEPIRKLTPYPINNMLPFLTRDTMLTGPDAKDRTASEVYDTDNYDMETAVREHRTKQVDSYEEQMIRKLAKNNWLFALGANLFVNGYDPEGKKTGFAFYEMPTATRSDPTGMSWYGKHDFTEDDIPQTSQEDREAYLDQKAQEVLEDLGGSDLLGIPGKWVSPEEAVDNGFAMSYMARTNAIRYCYKQIALIEQDYAMRLQAGEYRVYEKGVVANTEKKAKISAYYDIVNNWLKNDAIPWRNQQYERFITDWNKVYLKEDGSPATEWEYLTSGMTGEKITLEYVPRGNHPTSYALWTTVEKTGAFNEETVPAWLGAHTDTQKVYDSLNDGRKIDMGIDAGRYPNEVIFGGQGDLTAPGEDLLVTPGTEMMPTIGQRAWVPLEQKLPDEIKDMDQKEVALKYGIDMDLLDEIEQGVYDGKTSSGKPISGAYNTWVGYGGTRASYGGGSTYNPKIYSNPRSVNADYAKGMNVRQPYGATKTYLRPDFETKGSREAYRRSDF